MEYYPFSNFEVRGWENITPETASEVYNLTNVWYESTKGNFPAQFNKQEPVSEFDNFESKVSESITEKLWIFSSLPYHKVCLINRNKVYINGVLDEKSSLNMGGTAINQKNGYDFYTKRGDKGETSMFDEGSAQRTRVSKNSSKVEVLGAIDELNSLLGIVKIDKRERVYD